MHTHPAKQWAAVTTQELSTRTPPHIRPPSNWRLTSQGQLPGGAGEPPTIRERGCVMFCTVDDLWPHTAAGTERNRWFKNCSKICFLWRNFEYWSFANEPHASSLTEIICMNAWILLCEYMYTLTLCMRLCSRFQVLHCVKQAALEDTGAATLTHDPDAGLFVQFTRWAAMLIVCTGLAQSPTPLSFILKLLGFTDDITDRFW